MNRDAVMLTNLSIGRWTGRKFDRKVSDETTEVHHAQRGAVRANKMLLPRHVFSDINKAYNNLRYVHTTYSLPWGDDEARMLCTRHYFDYMDAMRNAKDLYDRAASVFSANYLKYVEEAKDWLQDMYDINDYPAHDTIRSRFYVDLAIRPLPHSDDFRIDLGENEVKRIRDQIEKRNAEALEGAMAHLGSTLCAKVVVLHNSLSNPDQRFFASLIQNVLDVTAMIPVMNLTGDPELETIRNELERVLMHVDAKDVRKDPMFRDQLAKDIGTILEKYEESK